MKKKLDNPITDMINDISNYKNRTDLIENKKFYQIIHLDLSNGDIYEEYSNESLLKKEIYDFIEETYEVFSRKNKLFKLEIDYPFDADSKEIDKINSLLRTHYAIRYMKLSKSLSFNTIVSTVLLAIGVIILILSNIIKKYNRDIFFEVFQIFAWVFIWESCQRLFLESNETRKEKAEYFILYLAMKELTNPLNRVEERK